jgi:hypothetical protein
VSRQRYYSERGQPVEVLIWRAGRGPRNVLIRRAGGLLAVRPFRGLRRLTADRDPGSITRSRQARE